MSENKFKPANIPTKIQPQTPNFSSNSAAYGPPSPDITSFNVPPSSEIREGMGRMTAGTPLNPSALSGGLLDRLGGAWQAGMGALGLPQEAVSRGASALTGGGGTEAMPSDVLHRIGVIGNNPVDQFVTNLTLDPWNLTFGGIPGHVVQGLDRVREVEMIAQRAKPLPELVLEAGKTTGRFQKHPLLFAHKSQLDDLMIEAGISLPVRQHPEFRSWYVDYAKSHSPKLVRQQLRQAIHNKNAVIYDANLGAKKLYKPEAMPGDPQHYSLQGWQKVDDEFKHLNDKSWTLEGLKSGEERSLWVKLFGTPQNYSPFLKGQAASYDEGNKTFANYRKDFSDFVIGHTKEFDFHQGRSSPRNRAFLYLLKGDKNFITASKQLQAGAAKEEVEAVAKALEKVKDKEALAIYQKEKTKIDNAVTPIKQRIFSDLEGFDFIPKLNRKFGGSTTMEAIKADGFSDDAWHWLTGSRLDMHSADPVSHLLGMNRRLGKERFLKPLEKSIVKERKAMVKDGRMLPREAEYSETFSRAFTGQEPSMIDKELQRLIINNKDTLRGMSWNRKFNYLAKQTEGLIASAEKGQSIMAKATEKGRRMTYASLLGFALDSSVRNVVGGTLNTITQYGLKTFENIVPAFKAATDKRWRDTMDLDKVLGHSNSLMEEWFQHTPFLPESATQLEAFKKQPGQTFYDWAMSPMQMTENFNRSLAYFTAVDHNIKAGGMSIGEATRMAVDDVKKLHFGYSNIDVSPYLNNPTARIFSQFMIYPFRQMELMNKWSKEGKGLNNKLMRYMLLTGAALNHGQRHGLDMTNILGIGVGMSEYPPYLRYRGDGVAPHPTLTPPVMKLAMSTTNNIRNFIDQVFTTTTGGPLIDQNYSPSQAVKEFGDLIRLTVPGGRYALKLTKHYTEAAHTDDVTKQWGDLAQFVGAKYDPSVNGMDRILSLVGFAPTSEQEKRDQQEMLGNWMKFYRLSIAQLNEKVLKGQDYTKLQSQIQKRMRAQYGAAFERMNVKGYVLDGLIRPSEMATLNRGRRNMTSPSNEAQISAFPKPIKDVLDLRFHR